jgi:hypothetical protein
MMIVRGQQRNKVMERGFSQTGTAGNRTPSPDFQVWAHFSSEQPKPEVYHENMWFTW